MVMEREMLITSPGFRSGVKPAIDTKRDYCSVFKVLGKHNLPFLSSVFFFSFCIYIVPTIQLCGKCQPSTEHSLQICCPYGVAISSDI